ncbi:MAG: hypothetical protein HYS38_07925, partial [Acidobacteria bacterium]|nr:hypothetical protein [Acidobacteriota bacterium]
MKIQNQQERLAAKRVGDGSTVLGKDRQLRNIHKTVLPNGLAVITESMPHVRSISLG